MIIQFCSKEYRVIKIPEKTKATGFENVKVGDILKFSLDLRNTARYRGIYSSDIEIFHYPMEELTEELNWTNKQNIFLNNISKFELEMLP